MGRAKNNKYCFYWTFLQSPLSVNYGKTINQRVAGVGDDPEMLVMPCKMNPVIQVFRTFNLYIFDNMEINFVL